MGDVRPVEQIEEFCYHVKAFRSAEREVLQNAEVHRGQTRCVQSVSPESQRSGREGEGVTLIRVKARQRIHRPSTLQCQNRCDFNMTERLREPSSIFFCLPALLLFVTDRQLSQRVENKALLLMLARNRVLRAQIERILRLLVEV